MPRLLAWYIQDMAVLPVAGDGVKRRIYLARRRDSPLSLAADALWTCISTVAGEVSEAVRDSGGQAR